MTIEFTFPDDYGAIADVLRMHADHLRDGDEVKRRIGEAADHLEAVYSAARLRRMGQPDDSEELDLGE